MKEGGIGVGSASIMLVFAVLCLTIFTMISLSSATTDKALANRLETLVTGYYDADTLAELILSDLLAVVGETGELPESAYDVDIAVSEQDGVVSISYICPINDSKELMVEVDFYDGSYEIKIWRMQETEPWHGETSVFYFEGF